ncbi:hypothetical protein DAPPUDRAFT_300805 [Daphnia pulex]|uniref:Uncharacterized protein n=1 Tax=Daphnia pulex TaxID=6669 RepID=E9G6B9_DAPPU|nr:hypothetical protein DAPPUDRAFT_300805 [Daphnia pulex]|eukprot:EFX84908.1 hypothetical protein DAPPUDRAFT_300805 [Daphnia pulex]
MGKRWAEMGQLFGDWWRAREDRALSSALLTAQTERKLRQSVEGQTATHPPHFSPPAFPPNRKVFCQGQRRSSQLPDALDFRGRSRTSSPSHYILLQIGSQGVAETSDSTVTIQQPAIFELPHCSGTLIAGQDK